MGSSNINSVTLFISNLDETDTEEVLNATFSAYGRILSTRIKRSPTNYLYAFVTYDNSESARHAKSDLILRTEYRIQFAKGPRSNRLNDDDNRKPHLNEKLKARLPIYDKKGVFMDQCFWCGNCLDCLDHNNYLCSKDCVEAQYNYYLCHERSKKDKNSLHARPAFTGNVNRHGQEDNSGSHLSDRNECLNDFPESSGSNSNRNSDMNNSRHFNNILSSFNIMDNGKSPKKENVESKTDTIAGIKSLRSKLISGIYSNKENIAPIPASRDPCKIESEDGMESGIKNEPMPEFPLTTQSYTKVMITHVEADRRSFYVRSCDQEHLFNDILTKLLQCARVLDLSVEEPELNQKYMVLFDCEWHRAVCVSLEPQQMFMLIDCGSRVFPDDIKLLPAKYEPVPPLAHKVCVPYSTNLIQLNGVIEVKLTDKTPLDQNMYTVQIRRTVDSELQPVPNLVDDSLTEDVDSWIADQDDDIYKCIFDGPVMTVQNETNLDELNSRCTPIKSGSIVKFTHWDKKFIYVRNEAEPYDQIFSMLTQMVVFEGCKFLKHKLRPRSDRIYQIDDVVVTNCLKRQEYSRAQIKMIGENNYCNLYFVDYGHSVDNVAIADVEILPEKLQKHQFYAVRVKLEDVRLEWLTDYCRKFLDLNLDKRLKLECKDEKLDAVRLRFLDEMKIIYMNDKLITNSEPPDDEIMFEKHMMNNKDWSEGSVKELHFAMIKRDANNELTVTAFEPDGELHRLCHGEQKQDITRHCNNDHDTFVPRTGEMCLVRLRDNYWYRGCVLGKDLKQGGVPINVHLIDYGISVPRVYYKNIRRMPKKFARIPMAAIVCTLKNIPEDKDWDDDVLKNKSLRCKILKFVDDHYDIQIENFDQLLNK